MRIFRWYGPALVLLLSAVMVTVFGPAVARQLAHEYQSQEIKLVKDSLTSNISLAEMSKSFKDVAKVVEPSVVHIQVYARRPTGNVPRLRSPFEDEMFRRWFGPRGMPPELMPENPGEEEEDNSAPSRPQNKDLEKYNVPQATGNGSGWVFSQDGYIITNNHVIDGADKIEVRFSDGNIREATVKGTDPKTDVAVLKVESDSLHPATLATTPVEQGEIVFAFGSPFRFDFSMSQGIVSAKGRQLGILDHTDAAGHRVSGYENFIQTDAAINPGNSGGPLTNIYGQVVGMNSAIASRTGAFNGLGFAIPIDMVKKVADVLIEKGKMQRGYLGIYIREMDPKLAKSFGFKGKGILVDPGAIPGGPAENADIQRGDIVTKLDGHAVSTPDMLRSLVADMPPGKDVELEIFRDGKTITKTIKLALLPEQEAIAESSTRAPEEEGKTANREILDKLGLDTVQTMSRKLAEKYRLKFTAGVLVTGVRTGSIAEAEGIRQGAIITDVMGQKVNSVEELLAELAKHDLSKGIRLSVRVGDAERFVLLELATK